MKAIEVNSQPSKELKVGADHSREMVEWRRPIENSPLNPRWREECSLHTSPFEWGLIRVFFTCEFASALAKSFPQEGFKFASYGGDSQGFYYRHLISNGVIHNSVLELEPSWKILAKLLASQEYARGLAELVGLRNVRGLKVDCALAVYNSGCWLKPHTDREHRILTQVIYLNDGWDPKFGGFLRLLNSERLDDVAEEVVPTLNTSVIFRRSDRSWHAVMPVHPEQGSDRKLIRRSVLFHLSSVGT